MAKYKHAAHILIISEIAPGGDSLPQLLTHLDSGAEVVSTVTLKDGSVMVISRTPSWMTKEGRPPMRNGMIGTKRSPFTPRGGDAV